MNPQDPIDQLERYYRELSKADVPSTAQTSTVPALRQSLVGLGLGVALAATALFATLRFGGQPSAPAPGWGVDPGATAEQTHHPRLRTEVPIWHI